MVKLSSTNIFPAMLLSEKKFTFNCKAAFGHFKYQVLGMYWSLKAHLKPTQSLSPAYTCLCYLMSSLDPFSNKEFLLKLLSAHMLLMKKNIS